MGPHTGSSWARSAKSDSARPTAHALYKADELALFEALMSKNMYAEHADC